MLKKILLVGSIRKYKTDLKNKKRKNKKRKKKKGKKNY